MTQTENTPAAAFVTFCTIIIPAKCVGKLCLSFTGQSMEELYITLVVGHPYL